MTAGTTDRRTTSRHARRRDFANARIHDLALTPIVGISAACEGYSLRRRCRWLSPG
jgi:hypothetical protein